MITVSKTPFLLWPASGCFILSSTESASAGVSQVTLASFVATVSGMSLGAQSPPGLKRADPSQDPAQPLCALCCCDLVGCDGSGDETMGCVNTNAVPLLAYTSTVCTVKTITMQMHQNLFMRKQSSLPNGLPYTSKSLYFPTYVIFPAFTFFKNR